MADDAESVARGLLAELEERLAAKNLDQMADLFTDDVVLIGDSVENFDRVSTVAYLGVGLLARDPRPLLSAPKCRSFAGLIRRCARSSLTLVRGLGRARSSILLGCCQRHGRRPRRDPDPGQGLAVSVSG